MKIIDIRDMPNFNPVVKNGINSVSTNKILIKLVRIVEDMEHDEEYPYCIKHGTINKVTSEGIWRCLMCGEGCYEL